MDKEQFTQHKAPNGLYDYRGFIRDVISLQKNQWVTSKLLSFVKKL